jgi:glycosyltransferase involved in cell wall biosynthesis
VVTAPRRLRAAFLAYENPRDIRSWSGIPFHMLRAAEQHFEIVHVVEQPFPGWFQPLGRALKGLTARRFEYNYSPPYLRRAIGPVRAALRAARPDVVLAASVSPLAHLLVDEFRVVNLPDATFASMRGYYPVFDRIAPAAASAADAIERTLIRGALLSAYPSAWAADSARDDYGARPDQVAEIAWGANMDTRAAASRTLPPGEVRFLFVGLDWPRKGGPMAVAIVEALAQRGIACRLDVVGVGADALGRTPPGNVHFHGFVSKRTPEGRALLDQLFADAHFFLLPTAAECFGIVFAEAAAHALPSISYLTGGVPSAVRNGETGILLPLGASAGDFVEALLPVLTEPGRYAAMSAAALADSHDRLDWNVWARRLAEALTLRLG